MSKHENPVGIVIALLVTFGLSALCLLWAYQFGFGSRLDTVQLSADASKSTTPKVETKVQTKVETSSTLTPTATLTATPELGKTVQAVDNVAKLPIRQKLNFVIDSLQLTPSSQQALEGLGSTALKYTNEDVIIRIKIAAGESELNEIAQNRAEEIAGILRDQGFSKKIIISKKNNEEYTKQTRNQPIEVSLLKK